MDDEKKDICCQEFNPVGWDGKTHFWKDKLFIKDKIPQLFHIPIPAMIGKMITKQWKKATDAGAAPDLKDFLWLSYDPSPWVSEHYIYVTKEVPDAENVMFTGNYISKVFDGPYNYAPKWMKEMDKYLKDINQTPKKYYFYFTTCPKCAKKHGHNYVVLFAQV
ncbi:hydrolase [Patescibacteria group bacterium]